MPGYHDSTGVFRGLGDVFGITLAELKAVEVDPRLDNGKRVQISDGRTFFYKSNSTLTADDYFVVTAKGGGRFVLCPGYTADIALPIAFDTADAATLATLPTGCVMRLTRPYWEVTADWTGGSSSAIGISSGTAPHNTKGDILGGAGGDVAATLVAASGKLLGTVGADIAAGVLLKGGVTVRFDRITSAFTAGTGFAHIVGEVLANPG